MLAPMLKAMFGWRWRCDVKVEPLCLFMNRMSPSKESALQRIRALGHLLDNAIEIPGTGYRIGLDPIIGLLPVGGDTVGLFLSAYIVLEAARLGVPKTSVGRMVLNLLIDFLVGSIPVLGDLFDVAWKANVQNLSLLEAHIQDGTLQRKADRTFLVLLGLLLGTIVVTVAAVLALVVGLVWKLLSGL